MSQPQPAYGGPVFEKMPDLTRFAIRICTLANTILRHDDFDEDPTNIIRAKRYVLYQGMYSTYKISLRYLVDKNSDTTYEDLLEAARDIERQNERQTERNVTADHAKKDRAGYAGGVIVPS